MAHVKDRDIPWINSLKGICILLVVLHHSIITTFAPSLEYLSSGELFANAWIFFNSQLSPLRMPAFFFVSGLLAMKSVINRDWGDVFTKRVTNLLYLYLLWGLIQWICISWLSSTLFEDGRASGAKNAAYSSSLTEFAMLIISGMTSLWYLYALGLYFLIAKIFKNNKITLLLIAIGLNYLSNMHIIPGWGPNGIARNMVFFIFGVFFSDYLLACLKISKRNAYILAAFIALAALNHLAGFTNSIFHCAVAVLFLITIIQYVNKFINLNWLNWIGRNTLQIYVLHRIYIELFGLYSLQSFVNYEWFANPTLSLLWASLFPLLAVIICVLASISTWSLLNRGLGKTLFTYPRLLSTSGLRPGSVK